MDGNAYTAALVKSLVDLLVGIAWPVIVLILVIAFRPQVEGLLARLSRLKVFGAEAGFDPKTAEPTVAIAVATATATIVKKAEVASGAGQAFDATVFTQAALSERLAELVERDPRAAVVKAYEEVERVLRRTMMEANVPDEPRGGYVLMDAALQREVIVRETHEALRSTIVLRDMAVHGVEIPHARAREYLGLCDTLMLVIVVSRLLAVSNASLSAQEPH